MLNRKLLRDLSRLKGQIVTIALVVAAGLSGLIGIYSTFRSLDGAARTYYERYRFGEVFAHAKRVPDSMASRVEAIRGVQTAYPRIVDWGLMPVEGMSAPARAEIVSLPPHGSPPLNGIYLRRGRFPEAGRNDEVLVLEPFADAHGLEPGDSVSVVLSGTLHTFNIVGIALSPEFVFFGAPGEIFPDPKTGTVLWIPREAAAAAYQMEGAFNDIVVALQPGASEELVIDELDRLLEPYGGVGAYGRSKHPSHMLVEQETLQLIGSGSVLPLIFLSVAAFLLNVVLSRLVQLQRPEIATLKAVGYRAHEIGMHYFQFVVVIITLGAALGCFFGYHLGRFTTEQYADFFQFPVFDFRLDMRVVVAGIAVSAMAAIAGAFATVVRVMRLPPAEAMQPPSPPIYRRTLLERLGLYRALSHSVRMILRDLERRPVRFLVSWVGLVAAVSLLYAGRATFDQVNYMLDTQFSQVQREDVAVTFIKPMPESAQQAIDQLPGVESTEGHRILPVKLSFEQRTRDTVVFAFPDQARLRRIIDEEGQLITPPASGLYMSRKLADILGVGRGAAVRMEVLEGDRQTVHVRIEGLVEDIFGLQVYMRRDVLERLLDQPPTITDVNMLIDRRDSMEIDRRLKKMPNVLAVNRRDALLERFRDQLSDSTMFMNLVMAIVASVITIGVIYNNARVSLSMRRRDLASLRVLGFTRGEVSFILLGEQAIQVLLALPVGFVAGRFLVERMLSTVDPETYRIPDYVSPRTYLFVVAVTLLAAITSAMLVRMRLNRIDLTEVLKSRE